MKSPFLKSLIFVIALLLFVVIYATFASIKDNTAKSFIIDNKDSIKMQLDWEKDTFFTLNYDGFYYQDITIKKLDNECYTIVFWGDRKSWLWNIKLDKQITFDIPYDISVNGQANPNDLAILYILDKIVENNKK